MPDTQAVLRLLNEQSTLSLATTSADGTPRVASLYYLADSQLRLYWFSSGSSEHSRNLSRDSNAAVTIFWPTHLWSEIRGAQMRGKAVPVIEATLRASVEEAYVERYGLDAGFQGVIARTQLWVFDPDWVRYLDNSKYFGYQDEFELLSRGTE